MEKRIRVTVHEQEAVNLIAWLEDFEEQSYKWKDAVYELFRYNMTFSFAHDIEVFESNKKGVYVSLLVKPVYERQAMDVMDMLGFKKVQVTRENIGVISGMELPDDMFYVEVDI